MSKSEKWKSKNYPKLRTTNLQQCSGTTLEGSRCARTAKWGTGYCPAHKKEASSKK